MSVLHGLARPKCALAPTRPPRALRAPRARDYGREEVAASAPPTPFPKYGDHRDRALAARAGRGDEQAFAELYDRHEPGLLAFAVQYVGDRAAGEDVVQQTFMAAYRVLNEG